LLSTTPIIGFEISGELAFHAGWWWRDFGKVVAHAWSHLVLLIPKRNPMAWGSTQGSMFDRVAAAKDNKK
jgi:hypothetical protein